MNPRVLALDVDGVLTDCGIYLSEQGEELLRFDVRDGAAIARWLQSGRECVWVTARSSHAVSSRARRLGVRHLLEGVQEKAAALEAFLGTHGYCWDDVVYIGDDTVDLCPLQRAGFGVAVPHATPELKRAAAYVTKAEGGRGAVREVVDMLLGSDSGHHEAVQEDQERCRGERDAWADRSRAQAS